MGREKIDLPAELVKKLDEVRLARGTDTREEFLERILLAELEIKIPPEQCKRLEPQRDSPDEVDSEGRDTS